MSRLHRQHLCWTKGGLMFGAWTEQNGMRLHHVTQSDAQFKIYVWFASDIFHVILVDLGWPGITKTGKWVHEQERALVEKYKWLLYGLSSSVQQTIRQRASHEKQFCLFSFLLFFLSAPSFLSLSLFITFSLLEPTRCCFIISTSWLHFKIRIKIPIWPVNVKKRG